MVAQQKDRERLGILDRWLDLIFSILGMLLILGFFMAHQLSNTGFFTAEFGPTEMLALYGPMALAVLPAVIRTTLGLRNPGRPMEVIANAALAAGSLWLFFVFPFDFSHLPDVLPAGIQFLFGWITDGLARVVLILQVVIGTLTAVGKMWKFVAVQSR